MTWEKWVLLGILLFSSMMVILTIGKPRQPITPGMALVILLVNAGFAALVVFA